MPRSLLPSVDSESPGSEWHQDLEKHSLTVSKLKSHLAKSFSSWGCEPSRVDICELALYIDDSLISVFP